MAEAGTPFRGDLRAVVGSVDILARGTGIEGRRIVVEQTEVAGDIAEAADGEGRFVHIHLGRRVIVLETVTGILRLRDQARAGSRRRGHRGAGCDAGGVLRRVGERAVIGGRIRTIIVGRAVPIRGVVAGHARETAVGEVAVVARRTEKMDTTFEEDTLQRGLERIERRVVDRGHDRGAADIFDPAGLIGGAVVVYQGDFRRREVRLVPVVAIVDDIRVGGRHPRAGIGAAFRGEHRRIAHGIAVAVLPRDVGAEVTQPGILQHIGERRARAFALGTDADAQAIALTVGLEKLGVGRAVGEVAIDVDVNLGKTAAVDILGRAALAGVIVIEAREPPLADPLREKRGERTRRLHERRIVR